MNYTARSEDAWCSNITDNDDNITNVTDDALCDEICQVWGFNNIKHDIFFSLIQNQVSIFSSDI